MKNKRYKVQKLKKKYKRIRNIAFWLILMTFGQLLGMLVGLSLLSEEEYALYTSDSNYMTVLLDKLVNPIIMGGVILVFLFIIYRCIQKRLDSYDSIKGIFCEYISLYKLEKVKYYLYYFLFGVALNFVITIILFLITYLIPASEELNGSMDLPPNFLMFIFAGFFAPVMEEIVFRARIYDNLNKLSVRRAKILQALLFGLAHGLDFQGCYTFAIALLFVNENNYHNSILPSICMHIGINSVTAFSLLFPSLSLFILLFMAFCVVVCIINRKYVMHLR